MPRSDSEGRDWAVERYRSSSSPIVIDLGCGEGTYSDLMRGWRDTFWVGVEIWQPYIAQFELDRKYDVVVNIDARNFDFPRTSYVLLAGDVLEHMPRSDSLDIIERARENAEAIMVSLPVVEYPQHGHDNPYEAHLDQWTFSQMWEALSPGLIHGWRGQTLGRFWCVPSS